MAGVHRECLLVGHLGQVLHRQPVLRPVLEYCSVASVDDQLVRMLRHPRIQVVLDHRHDGRGLAAPARIFIDRSGVHVVGRAEAVHVDASVVLEFLGELRRQFGVELGREISQRVLQRQHFLFGCEDVFALRGVVYGLVVRFRLREPVLRDARKYLFLKLIH